MFLSMNFKLFLLNVGKDGEINFHVLGGSGSIYALLYSSTILTFIAEMKELSVPRC